MRKYMYIALHPIEIRVCSIKLMLTRPCLICKDSTTQFFSAPFRGLRLAPSSRVKKPSRASSGPVTLASAPLASVSASATATPTGKVVFQHSRGMPPTQVNLLVMAREDSPELSVLKALPSEVKIVATGLTPSDFAALTDAEWDSINALLVCGVGARAAKKDDIRSVFLRLKSLRWMHSASAGLEHLLFPELIDSKVDLTNAKSAYSHSLAEWTLFSCSYFAKHLQRLLTQKRLKRWEQFEVEELRGKTLGVVGLGDIGSAVARLARAHGMRPLGLRRRALGPEEAGLVDELYHPDRLVDLVKQCDYVVASLPWTPQTDKFFSRAAFEAMKPHAVFINVGRGKTVDEDALIATLHAGSIRGAALDVFAVEPLPQDSPLWDLENVLLSPHSADRTAEFQVESLQLFVKIAEGFARDGTLFNICDKKAGY